MAISFNFTSGSTTIYVTASGNETLSYTVTPTTEVDFSLPTLSFKTSGSEVFYPVRYQAWQLMLYSNGQTSWWPVSWNAWTSSVGKNVSATAPTRKLSQLLGALAPTSLFGNKNRTSKTCKLTLVWDDTTNLNTDKNDQWWTPSSISKTLSTITVTLNAPPTVTYDPPTYATPHYTGLGAYSINVTQAKAQYSGYVNSITLTIGTDSVTQTYSTTTTVTNQTMSLTPTVAGTYTPTLTVTDTRGQTTTVSLPQITVNPYNAPSLDFDVFRSNSSGVRDDEGAYGLVTANISFTDAVADITEPTVQINGTTTSNVTWYSAYNSSTGVSNAISDWSTVSDGDTIYGLINGSFAQTDSYQITITLEDSLGGESSAITQTLSTAFYTIDFQAGGKEISFGGPANDNLTSYPNGLFKCGMEAQFNEAVHAQANNVFIDSTIDPTQTPTEYKVDKLQIIDANGDRIASFHAEQTTSTDKIGAGFNANRIVNGTNIFHGIMFHIDSNGTRTVYLNYPQAFRDALGIVDYVVEEGTSTDGRSRWRKWNSGRAEFWYHHNVVGVTTAVWTAPIYYMDTSTFSNIWKGVFNGSPFSVHCDSNSSQFISTIAYAWNSNGITSLRYLSVGAKTNNNVPTSIYAVGTWK